MSTARRDTPDEWGGPVSHWMNEKDKTCHYCVPKKRSETMEDMIRFMPASHYIFTVAKIFSI